MRKYYKEIKLDSGYHIGSYTEEVNQDNGNQNDQNIYLSTHFIFFESCLNIRPGSYWDSAVVQANVQLVHNNFKSVFSSVPGLPTQGDCDIRESRGKLLKMVTTGLNNLVQDKRYKINENAKGVKWITIVERER